MPDDQMPWRSGLVRSPMDASQDRAESHEQRLTAAVSLSDLTRDYGLYTPALLYLCVRLAGRDPFHDFLAEHKLTASQVAITLEQPVFLNLPGDAAGFARRLFLLEKETFAAYCRWVGTLAFLDEEANLCSRVRYQALKVPDYLWMSRQAVLPGRIPCVDVLALTVESSESSWYFQPTVEPVPRHRAVCGPGSQTTAAWAAAVRRGDSNPYAASAAVKEDLDGPSKSVE